MPFGQERKAHTCIICLPFKNESLTPFGSVYYYQVRSFLKNGGISGTQRWFPLLESWTFSNKIQKLFLFSDI